MKKTVSLILCICLCAAAAGCGNQMNMNTVLKEPNFAGIVEEVYDGTILVAVNEDEDEYKSSDLISVSLDVELKDGLSEYEVGDEVRVYYDGTIAESYPAQIMKVYAITIVNEHEKQQ